MSFFKKITGGASKVFKKATGDLDVGLRKIGNTAGTIGGYVNRATPYLSMIDPELGAGASQLSQGLQQGRSIIKDSRGVVKQVKSGDISGAIQKAKDMSSQQPSTSFY